MSSEYPEPPASALTAPPASAIELFGAALPRAVKYAGLLADAGVQRGLIGPREVGRLWERHLVNCAVVAEEIPADALVVDVGSGAGLPGIVIALARPDVQVALLEPLLRRTVFLEEMVGELELDNVTVVRGRAEEWAGRMDVEVVTARAVAPLERLVGWCLPLLGPKGRMLALKGETATAELAAIRGTLPALGVVKADVVEVGARFGEAATRVVRIDLGARGYLTAQSSAKRSNSKQTKSKQVKAPQPKPRRQIHGD